MAQKNKSKTKIASRIFNFLFYVSTISIILGAIFLSIAQNNNQSLFGYRAFGVLSDSMVSPNNQLKNGGFRSGDIIILKKVKDKDIKVGDIVTYQPSIKNDQKMKNNFLTHRVVSIKKEIGDDKGLFITTKGDANQTNDMPIKADRVLGNVIYRIPKISGILQFVRDNLIVTILFTISLLGFMVVIRLYILDSNFNEKPKRIKKRKNIPKSSIKKRKIQYSSTVNKSRKKPNLLLLIKTERNKIHKFLIQIELRSQNKH